MAEYVPTTAPNRANYFPAIDGLRLLASINIVMLHLGSSSALAYMADFKWLMPLIDAPAFAAGIFYVFAGFLFASKFSDPERRIPVIPFMFARIAKLYRLHFFMTILMFVVLIFKFSGYTHLPGLSEIGDCASAGLAKMTHPWRSLLLHLSLTWSIVPDLGMKLNEPSWSLTSFFMCYAITPWFSRWLFRQNYRTLWVLFGTLFIPGILWAVFFGASDNLWFSGYEAKYRFFHIFAPVRIFEYLFGMVLFRLYNEGGFDFLKKKFASGIAQAVTLAAIYGSLFLLRPVPPEFFFRKGLPVIPCDLGVPRWIGCSNTSRIALNNSGVLKNGLDVERLVWRNMWKFANLRALGIARAVKNVVAFSVNRVYIAGTFGHIAQPHLKSTFEEIWRTCPRALDRTSRSRFRTDDCVSHWLASAWDMVSGRFFPANEKRIGEFIALNGETLGRVCDIIRRGVFCELCLNDKGSNAELERCFAEVARAFESILPEKSSFEK